MIEKLRGYPLILKKVRRLRQLNSHPVFRWGLHKQMWGILAETGWDNKSEALWRMGIKEEPRSKCFACEAESALDENVGFCPFCVCPLDWGFCTGEPCVTGLYGMWLEADSSEERKRIAALIRDLPLAPYARDLYEVIDD